MPAVSASLIRLARVLSRATAGARVVVLSVALATYAPCAAAAQSSAGVSVAAVEAWIRGKVSPERAWTRDLSSAGVAFRIDPATEVRLRRAGASDEWIAVLRRARYNPGAIAQRRRLTRDELQPLYFGRAARIEPYVDLSQMRETGGLVRDEFASTTRGDVLLNSRTLPEVWMVYGLVVNMSSSWSLDFGGAFMRDFLVLDGGLRYAPFLPLGASGVRAIVSVEPRLGITRQTLARLERQSYDDETPVVDVMNATAGGSVGVGIAYHWRPGRWLSLELQYKQMSAHQRTVRSPDNQEATRGIPWSPWRIEGTVLRIGFGCCR